MKATEYHHPLPIYDKAYLFIALLVLMFSVQIMRVTPIICFKLLQKS